MEINADFGQRVVLHADDIPWRASPMAGVERRPLDRIGDEVARATSFVRYAPGSQFSAHTHDGGEEYIVLDGVFQDEHGDFPAGHYVRNPPTSRHTPSSADGCIIFVKLWQFDPADRTAVHVDLGAATPPRDADRPGIASLTLFEDAREQVRLEEWSPGTAARFVADGGAEILVLEGEISESGTPLRKHSWVRVPIGATVDLATTEAPARLWIKTGHLRHVAPPPTA